MHEETFSTFAAFSLHALMQINKTHDATAKIPIQQPVQVCFYFLRKFTFVFRTRVIRLGPRVFTLKLLLNSLQFEQNGGDLLKRGGNNNNNKSISSP